MAGFSKPLAEAGNESCVCFGRARVQQPDHRHRWLLRVRRERPCRRTAEQRDDLAPPHSITSSAIASKFGGTSMSSALAVVRLITSSNLVGSCTGRSAGAAPFSILSTYWAAWRYVSTMLVP